MIDLLSALTPEHIHVGYDRDTGIAVHVPRAHFEQGVNGVGATGSGKTDFVVEFLRALAFSGAPWAYFDFAGSGYRASATFDALAATLLGLGVEALYADTVPEAAGVAGRFMRRHAYVTVGEDDPPVRLNILRRLRRKDGRRETPQRVAGRFADVWSTQYAKDADIRVRFAKWCTVAAGLLSAADRPITEYHLLFEDPMYRAFLRRAQAAAKTADDPFVREQWQILDSQFLALAKTPGERPTARSWRSSEACTTRSGRCAAARWRPSSAGTRTSGSRRSRTAIGGSTSPRPRSRTSSTASSCTAQCGPRSMDSSRRSARTRSGRSATSFSTRWHP